MIRRGHTRRDGGVVRWEDVGGGSNHGADCCGSHDDNEGLGVFGRCFVEVDFFQCYCRQRERGGERERMPKAGVRDLRSGESQTSSFGFGSWTRNFAG